MDGNAMRVLSKILEVSPNGEAVVLDVGELTSLLSHAVDPKRELKQILGELDGAAMIALKYADKKQCCVASLPKGRLAAAEKSEVGEMNRKVLEAKQGRWKRLLAVALAAFLGGAAGAAVVMAIFARFLLGALK